MSLALPAPAPTARPPDTPDGLDLIGFARHAAARLREADAPLYKLLAREAARQNETLMMVAASSVADPSVLACSGTSLSNLTAEGYPGARYHAGCEVADEVERLAADRACSVFGAREAIVQPHSGSSANLAVITALLNPGDTLLGLDLDCGGHLTHGSPASLTGRYYNAKGYRVTPDGFLDYGQIRELALAHRPKLLVCGASAYPRTVDFARFREIADEANAFLLADISHIAGLVATGLHPSPIDHAHVTTTSTYKQLYGPRGGLILLGRDAHRPGPGRGSLAATLRRAVFPFTQGTPDLASIAAKARALDFVAGPGFAELAQRLAAGAQAIAERLAARGLRVVTGGTDTHMVLLDLRGTGLTGDIAEQALESCGIVVNRNRVPGDTTPARVTGGLRIGSNTLAARGMDRDEAAACADLVADVLEAVRPDEQSGHVLAPAVQARVRAAVAELCARYPLPAYAPRHRSGEGSAP
ncbi:Serine hydroxymethyltransferase [Frankia canadensis]|uniref:Probable serine hydroxymethyltransferase n=1 Tax=Frankia canadensis TaxID=1836972 RepID=A0A2I2L280_9ACTN|nr:serine hydroxymethyltransferase [Frankia canadensis]SNQ52024.1 Serine hydroxymethyltransferase [Frankia canadensis]SOU59314.1 Serine hydroxymethyltransferase [Frankia canadensis]